MDALPIDAVRPRYDGGSVVNLVATIGRHFGLETGHPPLASALGLEGEEAAVVLIVDALGAGLGRVRGRGGAPRRP